ncbi:MAG: N,N-dimethylformamidase beta subunit family domain-containing protein, partial [Alphaproteobacteria bacterium]
MIKISAYSDVISVSPGDTIQFMVSCEDATTFQANFMGIRCGDESPGSPGYKDEPVDTPAAREYPGRKQAFNPGSYVHVPHATIFESLTSFTVQACVYPTMPGPGSQAIIAKLSPDGQTGFALMLDKAGAPVLELRHGDDVERHATDKALTLKEWAFLAASYDAKSGSIRIYQESLKARSAPPPWQGTSAHRTSFDTAAPLTMGATLSDGDVPITHAFNGRIDTPRLANRALDRADMAMIVERSPSLRLQGAIVGAWDFSREIMSDRIVDLSENRLHGTIVNQPARAVKGYNWTAEVQDWKSAPEQYGAIHFHDDDMIDAKWQPDVILEVPAGLQSGFYAARFSVADDEAFVPFYIRRAKGTPAKPIAVLASTATYLAYGNYQFDMANASAEKQAGALTEFGPAQVYLFEHPEIGPSIYDHHADGSPCMYTSRLRPLFNVAPKTPNWSYNADTHLTDWMEAKDFDYDVITDDDIHREGLSVLSPYEVVVTGAHPEYWSTPMWQAMTTYLDDGGRLMYLGGNGFYWRTAYHPQNDAIIEVRRAETGERYWVAQP